MNQSKEFLAATERARLAMSAELSEIAQLPHGEERTFRLQAIATMLVGSPDEMLREAIRECPDLERVEPVPDSHLHVSETQAYARLSNADIGAIDRSIIENSTNTWQKAERVVGYTLLDLGGKFPDLSLGMCAKRIEVLVDSGVLEAHGNINFMRLCKIMRSTTVNDAA